MLDTLPSRLNSQSLPGEQISKSSNFHTHKSQLSSNIISQAIQQHDRQQSYYQRMSLNSGKAFDELPSWLGNDAVIHQLLSWLTKHTYHIFLFLQYFPVDNCHVAHLYRSVHALIASDVFTCMIRGWCAEMPRQRREGRIRKISSRTLFSGEDYSLKKSFSTVKDVCKETFCNCYDGDYEVFIEGLPSDRHIHIVLWLSIGLCYHFTQWVTVLIAIVSHMWYKDMASQVLLIISTVITTRRYIQCGCTSSLSVASILRTPTTTRRLMPRCQHLLIHNSHITWSLPVLCRSLRPLQSAIYHVTVKTVHDASFLKKLST